MHILKQSTAVDVLIGPFVDITDGATAETGESPTVKLSKNGQTLAAKNDVTTPVHDADGYYNCELDATDTNTVGNLVLTVAASASALPIRHEFQVMEEATYDALYGASASGFDSNGRVDVALIEGSDATDQINAACDTALTDYDALVPADLPTNFSDLSITATTGRVDVASIAGTSQTANDNGADINTLVTNLATVDSNVDAILVDTNELQTDWANGGRLDLIIDSILVDTGTTLDTKLDDIQGATFSSATDSLEAIRDRGDSAWTGSATTSHNGTAQTGTSTTITLESGASTADDTYNNQIIYISSGTGAGQSKVITDYDGGTLVATTGPGSWGTTPDATSVYEIYPDGADVISVPTAANIADAVWDESTAGHTSAGTFGEQCKNDIDAILTDTGTTLDGKINTIDTNVDAVLVDTATLGAPAGADFAADIAAIKSDTGSVSTDTTNLTSNLATVDTNVDSILAATITNAAGVDIAADIAAVKSDTAAVLVDTGTTLDTAITTIDTVVDAIKAKTDSLTFTQAGHVDSNVQRINDVAITGDGSATPFDV